MDRIIFWEPWVKEGSGWLITKPFKLEGSQLEVNADAKKGQLAVEMLDGEGRAVPGFSRSESRPLEATDGLRLQLLWGTSATLSSLRGKAIRLKFYLNKAKLYAFQVRP